MKRYLWFFVFTVFVSFVVSLAIGVATWQTDMELQRIGILEMSDVARHTTNTILGFFFGSLLFLNARHLIEWSSKCDWRSFTSTFHHRRKMT